MIMIEPSNLLHENKLEVYVASLAGGYVGVNHHATGSEKGQFLGLLYVWPLIKGTGKHKEKFI